MPAGDGSNVVTDCSQLDRILRKALDDTPIIDVHTHLFSTDFGDLLLWGVDELLTYHYLIAEVCRAPGAPTPQEFYSLSKVEQADTVWQHLFVDSSPVSEACRGVLTTLQQLEIDASDGGLNAARDYFSSVTVEEYIDTVFELSHVRAAVMTNDPLDPDEKPVWEGAGCQDDRFIPALRLDRIIVQWQDNWQALNELGYDVTEGLTRQTYKGVRAFLEDQIANMQPVYMAVSLPHDFQYPADDPQAKMIANAVLPTAEETDTPFAPMIGVKRQVNPALKLAGDGVGKCDMGAIERMCGENPDIQFLTTLLSRENQHELCVAARKMPNLMPFGFWWFLNDPMTIDEIARMRLELLGLSMIPQHSDARVLDQLIYKWKHTRDILHQVLLDKYSDLMATGWQLTQAAVADDIERLFSRNFTDFVGRDI